MNRRGRSFLARPVVAKVNFFRVAHDPDPLAPRERHGYRLVIGVEMPKNGGRYTISLGEYAHVKLYHR
jgi:hypothetical protein